MNNYKGAAFISPRSEMLNCLWVKVVHGQFAQFVTRDGKPCSVSVLLDGIVVNLQVRVEHISERTNLISLVVQKGGDNAND